MTETFASVADRDRVEREMPWAERDRATTIYEFLTRAKTAHGKRPALSFQITSGPQDPAVTLSWDELHAQVTQAANLFHSLGVPLMVGARMVILKEGGHTEPLYVAESTNIVRLLEIFREEHQSVAVAIGLFPPSDIRFVAVFLRTDV